MHNAATQRPDSVLPCIYQHPGRSCWVNSRTRLPPVSWDLVDPLTSLHPDIHQFLFLAAQCADFFFFFLQIITHARTLQALDDRKSAAQVTRG